MKNKTKNNKKQKHQIKEINLSIKELLLALAVLLINLAFILPNIYIKNQIYYTSRIIGDTYEQYIILSEENKKLKRKIESIQFKNQILNRIEERESEDK